MATSVAATSEVADEQTQEALGKEEQSVATQSAEVAQAEAPISAQTEATKDKSPWTVFFVSFAAGLLALITPCVFPMIPMTIAKITIPMTVARVYLRNSFIVFFLFFYNVWQR